MQALTHINIREVERLNIEREAIDVTCASDRWDRYIPGRATATFKCSSFIGEACIESMQEHRVMTLCFGHDELRGYVVRVNRVGSMFDVAIQLIECKELPHLTTPIIKKERPMKIRNRFYVAADRVTTPREQGEHPEWAKKTLDEAIQHAEHILEINPNKESVAIVRIVRVVRRKKAPVIVEVVK